MDDSNKNYFDDEEEKEIVEKKSETPRNERAEITQLLELCRQQYLDKMAEIPNLKRETKKGKKIFLQWSNMEESLRKFRSLLLSHDLIDRD